MRENSIVNLNGRPIKYILTQNPRTISLLKESGSMIVYESPYKSINKVAQELSYYNSGEAYREIWVSSYFLASGFGAQTRSEQQNLSYLATSYNEIIDEINDKINIVDQYAHDGISYLDETKVTRGLNEENPENLEDPQYNVSYNVFKFGNSNIYLKDLYKIISNIGLLYKLEISSIDYNVILSDNKLYHNFDNVPIGKKIVSIEVIIKGNTNDSGGIEDLRIIFNSKNDGINDETNNSISLNNISTEQTIPKSIYVEFDLSFIYNYNTSNSNMYIISSGVNYPIDQIQMNILGTPENSINNTFNKVKYEERIISDKNNPLLLKLYGVNYILYNILDNSDNNYIEQLYDRHPIYNNCNIVKINIGNNTKTINILVKEEYGRLINAEFVDNITNNIYNITNFRKTFFNSTYKNEEGYLKYVWDLDQNVDYDKTAGNPLFINKQGNNKFFNNGQLLLTFNNSINRNDIESSDNLMNYWISGEKLYQSI